MRYRKLAGLTLLSLAASAGAASAGSVSGATALALAGVLMPYASLPAADTRAVAAMFAGKTIVSYTNRISLTAERILCRSSNVDITARSCELNFKNIRRAVKGREANEIFATLVMAGAPSEGAAGSIFESISKLSCSIDPKAITKKAGAGADCTFETGSK